MTVPPDEMPSDGLPTSADVVVVGAGTAGAVVAGRLVERGDRSVLVVESGPDYGPFGSGRWPADLLDAATLPLSHDWGYVGPGAGGRSLDLARARVVGGCSTHNGCSQSVGWAGDYDGWAAAGLTGWSAAEFGGHLASASERMRITRYPDDQVQPLQRAFLAASTALGLPRRADLDDVHGGAGVDVTPVNIVDGSRWNAAFGYLDQVRASPLLTVAADTCVVRVLLQSGRVVGVEMVRGGRPHIVACGHVVLAAGAYGTPEVLLRSGIGAADELTRLGIGVAADLPGVGRNLHDHPTLALEFDATAELVARLEEFRTATGWLPEEQCIAKVASSVSDGPYDLHVFPWVEPRADSPHGWVVVLPVGLLTPRSRGSLCLAPGDHSSPFGPRPPVPVGPARRHSAHRRVVPAVRPCRWSRDGAAAGAAARRTPARGECPGVDPPQPRALLAPGRHCGDGARPGDGGDRADRSGARGDRSDGRGRLVVPLGATLHAGLAGGGPRRAGQRGHHVSEHRSGGAAGPSTADEQSVVAVLVDWYTAMERHDLTGVAAALTPTFLLVEHDHLMDAAALLAALAAADGQGRQTAELSEFDIVVDGDLAWSTHRNQEVWYPTVGEALELEFLETVILRRHGDSWRIERYHASRLRPAVP